MAVVFCGSMDFKHSKVPGARLTKNFSQLDNVGPGTGRETGKSNSSIFESESENLRKQSLRFASDAANPNDCRAYRGLWRLNKSTKADFVKYWTGMGFT